MTHEKLEEGARQREQYMQRLGGREEHGRKNIPGELFLISEEEQDGKWLRDVWRGISKPD